MKKTAQADDSLQPSWFPIVLVKKILKYLIIVIVIILTV